MIKVPLETIVSIVMLIDWHISVKTQTRKYSNCFVSHSLCLSRRSRGSLVVWETGAQLQIRVPTGINNTTNQRAERAGRTVEVFHKFCYESPLCPPWQIFHLKPPEPTGQCRTKQLQLQFWQSYDCKEAVMLCHSPLRIWYHLTLWELNKDYKLLNWLLWVPDWKQMCSQYALFQEKLGPKRWHIVCRQRQHKHVPIFWPVLCCGFLVYHWGFSSYATVYHSSKYRLSRRNDYGQHRFPQVCHCCERG